MANIDYSHVRSRYNRAKDGSYPTRASGRLQMTRSQTRLPRQELRSFVRAYGQRETDIRAMVSKY